MERAVESDHMYELIHIRKLYDSYIKFHKYLPKIRRSSRETLVIFVSSSVVLYSSLFSFRSLSLTEKEYMF